MTATSTSTRACTRELRTRPARAASKRGLPRHSTTRTTVDATCCSRISVASGLPIRRTTSASIRTTRVGASPAAWEDFDADGDADLYVANDFGRNNLYRSDVLPDGSRAIRRRRGRRGSRGRRRGDVGRVGRYRSRWSNGSLRRQHVLGGWASRRVPRVRSRRPGTLRRRQRCNGWREGNSLFLAADGRGRFRDVTDGSGAGMGRWAWSSPLVDIDNDGWLDIVVANGYLTNTRDHDL